MSSGGTVVSTVPPIGHAVGGAIGSALALLLFYPLERARIEMQSDAASLKRTDERKHKLTTVPTVVVEQVIEPTPFRKEQQRPMDDEEQDIISVSSSLESWDHDETNTQPQQKPIGIIAKRTVHKQGLLPTLARLHDRRELYQGARSVVITLATSSFIFFYSHQALQELLIRKHDATKSSSISAGRSLLGSCLAGIINVLLTNPMWVANMRIIKGGNNTSQKSLWKELQHIIQSEGWQYLWNGTGASLLLVSNPVLQFFVYEQAKATRLKTRITPGVVVTNLSPLEAFCVGALAKAIATIATYPLQLAQVLLRLQNKGVGTWGCLKEQFHRGGVRALFTGMNAKLLQTVLTASFTFLTYEQILRVVSATLPIRESKQQQKLTTSNNL